MLCPLFVNLDINKTYAQTLSVGCALRTLPTQTTSKTSAQTLSVGCALRTLPTKII